MIEQNKPTEESTKEDVQLDPQSYELLTHMTKHVKSIRPILIFFTVGSIIVILLQTCSLLGG